MNAARLPAFSSLAAGLLGGAAVLGARWLTGGALSWGWAAAAAVVSAALAVMAAAWAADRRVGPLRVELERKGAEDARRIAGIEGERGRLLQIFENLPLGLLVLDARGRIALHNLAARDILGFTGDPSGRTPIEVVRSGELQSAVDAARRDPGPRSMECTLVDAGRRIVTAHLFAIEADLVIVVEDVTRIRRLEEARRDMVGNIGHELRTPLSAILGYLETLEQSPELPASDRARFLGIISRNSRRLERLVRDLSRLSRLESAGFEPTLASLDLAGLVGMALDTMAPRAAEKSLRMEKHLPHDLPPLWADRDGLETVLLNLLDNAVRVTPPGGGIRVTASRQGDRVRVWVDDEGPGVPAALRDRVFERFYRLDSGRSAQEGGTGLGLAIVKHTLLQQGGEVGLEEAPGGGARVWFTVPVAATAPSPGSSGT